MATRRGRSTRVNRVRPVNAVLLAAGYYCIPGVNASCLLPVDPDESARRIRDAVGERLGVAVAVLVSDTFGRL